jgi:hypothetical protein
VREEDMFIRIRIRREDIDCYSLEISPGDLSCRSVSL